MSSYWALTRDLTRFWSQMAQSSVYTATTLSHRLPMLAGLAPAPSKEMDRMVSEKIRAAQEGMLNASWAWRQEMTQAFLQHPNPAGLVRSALKVADAALEPGRRTVKANATRLSSRKHS